MFFTYLRREPRRRIRQTAFVAWCLVGPVAKLPGVAGSAGSPTPVMP